MDRSRHGIHAKVLQNRTEVNCICVESPERRCNPSRRIEGYFEHSSSQSREQVRRAPNRRIVAAETASPVHRPPPRGNVPLAAGLAVTGRACQASAESRNASQPQGKLPQVPFGPHSISRLVAGGNPPAGGSHQTKLMDMHYREYFTLERTVEFLHRCQAQGINTWQTSYSTRVRDVFTRFRSQGGTMQWICLCPPRQVMQHPNLSMTTRYVLPIQNGVRPTTRLFDGQNTVIVPRQTLREKAGVARPAEAQVIATTRYPLSEGSQLSLRSP